MISQPDTVIEGDLQTLGWTILRNDPALVAWAASALPAAEAALGNPAKAHWYRQENTWFVGVDCLPNDAAGRVGDGPALPLGRWADVGRLPLHPGQVSAVFPGYPQPMPGESAAATRFRQQRDGAHVDGLLPIGADKRRMLKEPHAWIFGVALTRSAPDASPPVVWDGSHKVMQAAFAQAFAGLPPSEWCNVDVTEPYQTARRQVLDNCPRRALHLGPGDGVIMHRHLVHGIAPWRADHAPPRIVVYFRPETTFQDWLTVP